MGRNSCVFCKPVACSVIHIRSLSTLIILERQRTVREARCPVLLFVSEFYPFFCFRAPIWSCKKWFPTHIILSYMDEVHWGLKRYIHDMKNFDYQNVNALDNNMVSLYLLCVYHVCFCSALKAL